MNSAQSWILGYLLNSLWQVPLIVCAAWAAARLARSAGPQLEHRIWACCVLMCTVLPLCRFQLGGMWDHAWKLVLWFRGGASGAGETQILLGPGRVADVSMPWLSAAVGALATAYLGVVLFFAGRLLWGVARLHMLRRRSQRLEISDPLAGRWNRLMTLPGIDCAFAELAVSTEISGPATVGVRRPALLLPPGFLEKLDNHELEALLAHEFAHMRRRDFAKNLLYGLLTLPVAYHPALWLARAQLDETRELVCDAVAADALGGRERYARSLLRLAAMLSDRVRPRVLHAIGILDANTFERRVMHLKRKHISTGTARRIFTVTACGLIAVATCTTALALRMEVSAPHEQEKAPVKVKITQLKIVKKVPPQYPQEAKAHKDTLNGKVVLDIVIGTDGSVRDIKVERSLREDYDKNAMDAVRQWVYEPVLFKGQAIEVESTVTITYELKR